MTRQLNPDVHNYSLSRHLIKIQTTESLKNLLLSSAAKIRLMDHQILKMHRLSVSLYKARMSILHICQRCEHPSKRGHQDRQFNVSLPNL